MKIGIIYGSSRPSTVGNSVAKWVESNGEFGDHHIELIDLSDANLPLVPEAMSPMMNKGQQYETSEIQEWSSKVKELDAFIFVVAEYNMGYTPLLKNAIDVLFHEWVNKPVAYVSYGSYPTSTAVEQLRTVMIPFKSDQVDATVHIAPAYEAVAADGSVDDSKVVGSLQSVIDELIAKLQS